MSRKQDEQFPPPSPSLEGFRKLALALSLSNPWQRHPQSEEVLKSHFSQLPLSRKQHQTAHFGFLSKQRARANNDPNTVCKNSQGKSGLRFLNQFSRSWKKDLSLQAQMTPEKFGNPLQEKKQCLKAKMQQLQKEQYPNPRTSIVRSPVPLTQLGDC